jgi:hypothetical protein
MHAARGVLLDFGGSPGMRDLVSAQCPEGAPAAAILIRPDGYVAWAGDRADELDCALRRWFGRPAGASDGDNLRATHAP